MVAIESAYWGDEKQSHNITKRILDMVSGGKLNVTADEKLIPPLETSVTTQIKLSQGEEAVISKEATELCGPADQQCLEFQKERLRASKLREKETATQSTANVIKGRRLTLIVNRDGERKKIVVPDGNKYTLEGIIGEISNTGEIKLPDQEGIIKRVIGYIGSIITVTIYVLGILIPYIVLVLDGYQAAAYVVAVFSLIPYFGYFILIGYLLFKKFRS